MKRLATLAALYFLAIAIFAQNISGDTWEEAQANKKAKLTVTYFNLGKYVAVNENTGKLEGICVEVFEDFVQYLKDEKGIALTYEYVGDGADFKKTYNSVKNGSGGVFGLGNFSITQDRKKEISFTDPYLNSFIILVTSSSVPQLTATDNISEVLKGFKAYSLPGTVVEAEIERFKKEYLPDLEIVNVSSAEELTTRIANDPRSLTFIGMNLLLDSRDKQLRYHRSVQRGTSGVAFILPKDSDWTQPFNEFLSSDRGYAKSERFKQVLVKHIGESGYRIMTSIRDN